MRSHTNFRMLEIVERLARREVGIDPQVRARHARKRAHPGRLHCLGGRPAIPAPAPFPHNPVEIVLVRLAVRGAQEPGVRRELRPADHPAQGLPLVRRAGGDRDPRVVPAARVDVAGRRLRIAVAHRRVRFAAQRMVHPPLEGGADHRFPHGDVDHLPPFAMEVSGEQREAATAIAAWTPPFGSP